MTCKERDRQRFLARQAAQQAQHMAVKPKRQRRAAPRHAGKEEQQARYLDCGPGAWDDR